MTERLRNLWTGFRDWVEGNGPRPENEVIPPEPPPPLPFTLRPAARRTRFHELTLRERYELWLEHHGGHLFSSLYAGLSVLTCLLLVLLLLTAVAELPTFGHPENPANNEVVRRYVEQGGRETGAQNIVTGMILDYRAFDTFGETAVLFTSASCVLMLLGGVSRPRHHTFRRDDSILRGVASISIPAILILGCAVVINGHISPGGGFAGGAVLSTALILCANAYGFDRVHSFFPERRLMMSGSGALLAYAVMKGWSFFTGANHIPSGISAGTVGNILSGGLILPLNICVGLVVAGTLYGFYALFSEGEI
ncbi:MAG: hypothetical protein K6E38_00570 [Fretibacterium sp.]|nr:hypothetical protein [Fretibacterium sp.]